MECVSRVNGGVRIPVRVPVSPALLDHRFEGRAVFPAVEAMQVLAASARSHFPDADVRCMSDAAFDRFLFVPDDADVVDACCELTPMEDGGIEAGLVTRIQSKKASMRRVKVHVRLCFPKAGGNSMEQTSFDAVRSLDGNRFTVPPEKIYAELVPFGPAFQSICEDLILTEQGALAVIDGGNQQLSDGPLGSPFPLDGAFHAACVWGQRFGGCVPFPVGFGVRKIYTLARPQQKYVSRITPACKDGDALIFDILIYDFDDGCCEAVTGVRMKDVSAGRMTPPEWIKA